MSPRAQDLAALDALTDRAEGLLAQFEAQLAAANDWRTIPIIHNQQEASS